MKNKIIDEIKLKIKSGNGGNGCLSFYRNKNIKKGGPDGGNGGNGGNIYFLSDKKITTLNHLIYKKNIKAKNGKNGGKKNCTGKNGKDTIIKIPIGTKIIIKKPKKKIISFNKNKKKYLIAKGGKKGLGNNSFKSSKNTKPKFFTKGKKGIELNLNLNLIYTFNIGIIGLPNVGKSTLIKNISNNKKTKIKNYPFTTIKPNFGILKIKNQKKNISIIDTPGIIKGSYIKNNGLGYKFLKHINNCNLLLHIIEINKNIKKIIKNFKIIINELYYYNKNILKIEQWLIFNKLDLNNKKKTKKNIKLIIKNINWKKKYFICSLIKKKNIKKIKKNIFNFFINKKKRFN